MKNSDSGWKNWQWMKKIVSGLKKLTMDEKNC